jgi:hypothetical protein
MTLGWSGGASAGSAAASGSAFAQAPGDVPASAAADRMMSAACRADAEDGEDGRRPGSRPWPSPNWLVIWPARSSGELTRVTIEAAAIESSSAGTWATRASPMARMM